RNHRRITMVGFAVAVIGAVLAVASGTGYRFDMWGIPTAFSVLRYGAYVAVAGGVLSLVALIVAVVVHKGDFLSKSGAAVVGLVIGAVAFYIPFSMAQTAGS